MTLAESIASIAESQAGQKEVGDNGGPAVEKYQRATWLPVGAWSWCAAFVCWVIKQAIEGRAVTFTRPETAGAWDFERWCKSVDRTVMLKKPVDGDIKRGDVIIYTFSHIGIATGPPDEHGMVPTVEGNTNGGGDREGDGVYCKVRKLSLIRSRIRFSG